jgi:hypothetical protein
MTRWIRQSAPTSDDDASVMTVRSAERRRAARPKRRLEAALLLGFAGLIASAMPPFEAARAQEQKGFLE